MSYAIHFWAVDCEFLSKRVQIFKLMYEKRCNGGNYVSMHFVSRERIKFWRFVTKKKKKRNEKKKESFVVIGKIVEWNLNTLPFRISIEENEKVDGRYCGLGGIEDGAWLMLTPTTKLLGLSLWIIRLRWPGRWWTGGLLVRVMLRGLSKMFVNDDCSKR